MSAKVRILWADDEIDHLKPQIMFLEEKGYEIIPVTNGYDAIEKFKEERLDVVFLDESMPGIGGLDTLAKLKEIDNNVPVIMITKNEQEDIMEEAIGSQITDYLIKPVKPNQILLTLKRVLQGRRLVSEKTNSNYQQTFSTIFSQIQMGLDHEEWKEIYKRIIYWELELGNTEGREMADVMNMQKTEANAEFVRYVSKHYLSWISGEEEGPTLSHQVFDRLVFPNMDDGIPTILCVIDNLRFDQWKTIEPLLADFYTVEEEKMFFSILPTSTQYSRNAIFSGMTPAEMSRQHPEYWKNDIDEGGKNNHERDFLREQLKRKRKDYKYSYTKITNHENGKNMVDNVHNMLDKDLNVIVYNFVDMLSHARTEMEVLKELASDEVAYRSLTRSWFEHSPLLDALKRISEKKIRLLITTDHGTMRVHNPVKVVGDKNTTSNLRYKHGKNLNYKASDVLAFKDPIKAGLPRPNVSSTFIFALNDDFFVYPNNYNHYVNYYGNTFQHGGLSLEEVVIPFVVLNSKGQ